MHVKICPDQLHTTPSILGYRVQMKLHSLRSLQLKFTSYGVNNILQETSIQVDKSIYIIFLAKSTE